MTFIYIFAGILCVYLLGPILAFVGNAIFCCFLAWLIRAIFKEDEK